MSSLFSIWEMDIMYISVVSSVRAANVQRGP